MDKDNCSNNEDMLERIVKVIKECEEIKRICIESKSYGELLSAIDILKKDTKHSKY